MMRRGINPVSRMKPALRTLRRCQNCKTKAMVKKGKSMQSTPHVALSSNAWIVMLIKVPMTANTQHKSSRKSKKKKFLTFRFLFQFL